VSDEKTTDPAAAPARAAGSETAEPTAATGATTAEPTATAGSESHTRGFRKMREGLVVSDKMTKTIVVTLEDRVKHPRYAKVIRRTRKVKAHDESELAGVGDRVLLAETRPISATKRWRLAQILEKAQ
jgi:small subunit ribosomal protein S17